MAECMRQVYTGDEPIGRLTASRAAAVVRRDPELGARVRALRGLLQDWQDEGGAATKLWIEGLPNLPESADAVLDELSR